MTAKEFKKLHDQLEADWALLKQRWHGAGALWNDPVREHLQQEVWQSFEQTVPPTLKKLAELAELMAQAEREIT